MTNTSQPPLSLERQLVERVHAACVQTLVAAYDQAASDGLCAEGAWEVALEQLRALDLDRLLHDCIRKEGVSMGTDLFRFNIGHFSCLAIRDGDAHDFNRNILLINTGQQHVLVDTGNGRDFDPNRGLLLDRLRAVGISPADIDVVILSHADWDHIGGAVDESGTVVFPHARYVLARAEWDFWLSKPERLRPSDAYDEAFRQLAKTLPETRLAQLRDRLELIDSGTEIVPGIRSIVAPGHTPGYTVIAVSSGVDQFLSIGDLLYDPKDIEDPDSYSVYDFDPAQVVVTRRRVFEQAAKERALLQAYHLPFPGLGYIVEHGQGWQWRSVALSG